MIKVTEITGIPGVRIGNWEDRRAGTGCTVVIAPEGAPAGVDVRGGAPGTRETDLLDPVNLVDRVHGVFMAGGSAFGLDAAAGIMAYLEEQGIGFETGVAKVPIVTGAVLFDLAYGSPSVRPGKAQGYAAAKASETGGFREGSYGAGAGATVGKIMGMSRAMKSGMGSFCFETGGLLVGAVAAVNAYGNVFDPQRNLYLAGVLDEDRRNILDAEDLIVRRNSPDHNAFEGNTSIAIVITNGKFDKTRCRKIAQMAHNGFARTLRPSHTQFDGDSIFAMSVGSVPADLNTVGILAADAVAHAVRKAVKSADSLLGMPCHKDV